MCQQAARVMDLCVHGGTVKDGSPDTQIGMFAAARWGDGHICPMHATGRITTASTTVFINKVGAARKLDTIMCMVPATPAPGGQPHKVAAHYKLNPDNDEDYEKVFYADAKASDSDNDGKNDTYEAGAGMTSISKQGEYANGVGGRLKVDTFNAKVSAFQNYGGTKVEGKASVVSMEGSVYKGPPGDNGKNPYVEGGLAGDLLTASANAETLQGYDGKRIGIGAAAGASAAVASGEAKGRIGIPLGWLGLKDWTIDIKGGVSGGVGSVGASAGAFAFYDTQEKRFHLKGLLDIAAILGVGLNIDISIGKKFGAPTPPVPAPDAVKMGCTTVYIGG